MDGCCGSGGFLIEALTIMRNKVRCNTSLSSTERNTLIEKIANECIYGIDYGKDPPLARIARINMYLHGDGGSRIYYADALDKIVDDKAIGDSEVVQNMEELRDKLRDVNFDVVLTNPPFSMAKEFKNPSERRVLEQYDLSRVSATSTRTRPSLRSSVMFLERYSDVLRPGGRLVTVIDETLLSSGDFGYVRDFIRSRFLIRAIISLPGDTFRRSGSRVKTSVLVLEKKLSGDDTQPNWFYFFAEHVGADNLNSKASESAARDARRNADDETEKVVAGYRCYLRGEDVSDSHGQMGVLSPDRIMERIDLRNCVPLTGRMADKWRSQGASVRRLSTVVKVIDDPIRPIEFPDQMFLLMKVSYDGKCKIDKQQIGRKIREPHMQAVSEGQIVFSTIRATDGAIGVVPAELEGALVSRSSYTVFECESSYDTAYLWSILRSHELRADMQSMSPGSGRYTTYWPEVGRLLIPWPPTSYRKSISEELIALWEEERELIRRERQAMTHLTALGVESEESQKRWRLSKAPQ